MQLSIVILNYKQKGLVKQCVKGILNSRIQLEHEVIVVDNASNDHSLAEIEALFAAESSKQARPSLFEQERFVLPPLITIQAEKNRGYSAGNNLGIQKASGEYLLILNPDVAIVPGVIEKMVAHMNQHPEIGVLGPRLVNPDGSVQDSCRRFPGLLMPVLRRSMFGKLPAAKRSLDNYLMEDFDHHKSSTIDWLFGACLLIRKSVVEKVGLFDENFFLYFEDLDFCRRVWDAGFQVYYFADAELVHYHGRMSAEKTGLRALFDRIGRIHIESGVKYFKKYWGKPLPNRPHVVARQI